MTASAFVIVSVERGDYRAGAVVCPESRYCSIYQLGSGGISRRFVPASSWRSVEHECKNLTAGPLPKDSALVRSILGDDWPLFFLQYLHQIPVKASAPGDVAVELDRLVRSLVPSRLSLRQEGKGDTK